MKINNHLASSVVECSRGGRASAGQIYVYVDMQHFLNFTPSVFSFFNYKHLLYPVLSLTV